MTAIEKYVEAMENKDYAGLANLFSPDGIINDYCTNSAAQNEYHIYGREAINIFYPGRIHRQLRRLQHHGHRYSP